ncbi:MAG: DUF4364 family protein [Oscillospiraceae bacterium]|nr:DUF4364 family protein [Oscillospiraceae bacterium]
MQRLGFIHDMMDVKVLILYVTARSQFPMTIQQIYEVSFQDDCLSYFDVCTAIPEMVKSGHLQEVEGEKYVITEKGRHDGDLTAESIAYSVKQRAENAVAQFNRQIRRSSIVDVAVTPRDSGDYSVTLVLKDGLGELMKLELMAPDQRQANRLSQLMEKKAEEVYDLVMADLLDEEDF